MNAECQGPLPGLERTFFPEACHEETGRANKGVQFTERTPFNYADLTDYREGQITSLALIRSKGVNMTILAFDSEQLLPTHQTPGPALIQILDGTAYFTVGNEEVILPQGKSLLIPAGVPHSVIARERFKMLVTSILPLD